MRHGAGQLQLGSTVLKGKQQYETRDSGRIDLDRDEILQVDPGPMKEVVDQFSPCRARFDELHDDLIHDHRYAG